MRDSGEKFSPRGLGKVAVDKHSTGGVGDKTSFLVAPLAAACGLAVPMISGRALGHTGGTLDKLEAIPGFRTALTLPEFEAVLAKCGASIVSQTPTLVPADRVLYALRDRTGTVESPGLICASILSKKLAAGLNALVLDVKTGSGAFLRKREDAEYLAALMVVTAEAAGTHTVALMTDMGQPLGQMAGNWIELVECVELLRGERPAESEDLRELSLRLAGWMIALGGKAADPGAGLCDGRDSAGRWVGAAGVSRNGGAQGGDVSVFDDLQGFHKPGATQVLEAWRAATLRRWIRRRWAGRCSGWERGAKRPESRWTRMRGLHSTRGAGRRWSRDNRWQRFMPQSRRCCRNRLSLFNSAIVIAEDCAGSCAAGEPHLYAGEGGRVFDRML